MSGTLRRILVFDSVLSGARFGLLQDMFQAVLGHLISVICAYFFCLGATYLACSYLAPYGTDRHSYSTRLRSQPRSPCLLRCRFSPSRCHQHSLCLFPRASSIITQLSSSV
jgi:hypothetical protein